MFILVGRYLGTYLTMTQKSALTTNNLSLFSAIKHSNKKSDWMKTSGRYLLEYSTSILTFCKVQHFPSPCRVPFKCTAFRQMNCTPGTRHHGLISRWKRLFMVVERWWRLSNWCLFWFPSTIKIVKFFFLVIGRKK